ncbi:BQ2448_1259 [Microbotryum intermedium]|uniref:BQ2448_1259 protein n=1 Tax=Microbotryum intermedium TaxID=269621 RepID=A0A238F9I3_9BASI|nr:BQ2448_1259 [Microbotryum intermedium]
MSFLYVACSSYCPQFPAPHKLNECKAPPLEIGPSTPRQSGHRGVAASSDYRLSPSSGHSWVQCLRKFINGLAQHTKPPSNLTLKNANVRLMCGVEQERHFKAIKAIAITSLPSCLKPIDHTDSAEPLVRYG